MPGQKTNEFSIILPVDDATKQDCLEARTKLGAAQFADGPPHLTLLNGIVHPSRQLVSDREPLVTISPPLHTLMQHVPRATVFAVQDLPSSAYGDTTSVIIEPDESMRTTRSWLIEWLRIAGWRLDPHTNLSYQPHISLQLGSTATTEEAAEFIADKFPPGREITFSDWLLTRLVIVEGKRTFPIVKI